MRRLPLLLLLAACPPAAVQGTTDTDPGSGTETGSSTSASPTSSSSDPSNGTDPTSGPSSDTSDVTTSTTSGASSGSSSSGSSSSGSSSSGSTGAPLHQLVIEGFGSFPVTCELDDAHCGARTACELVTGEPCDWVEYDCANAKLGSYVTADYLEAPEDFSFGLYALTRMEDYGNICACQGDQATGAAFLQSKGLATTHTWCGLGHWYLE